MERERKIKRGKEPEKNEGSPLRQSPALSLGLFFALALLSERLEQASLDPSSGPCIRQLRPRYERQSKPWCPVGVLRNARYTGLGSRFQLQFRMLQLKTPVLCGL